MNISPLQTLLAIKALGVCEGITNSERKIGVALIDCVNRQTGQCDPSAATLSRRLGLSRRTIIRGTKQLELKGFFEKIRHGGNFNRNFYVPQWRKFREINAAWNVRNQKNQKPVLKVSPSRCQESHLGGDAGGTQTYSSNLSKKPTDVELQQIEERTPSSSIVSKRPGKEEKSTRAQPIASERFHVKSTNSSDAAFGAAQRRWMTALTTMYAPTPATFAIVLEAIDEALSDAATRIEMKKPGTGLQHVLDVLRARQSLPPKA